jgi:uncharacterized membrane protein
MTDTPARPRLPIIDIVRGVAIVAMAVYHLFWDLSYFRFIAADVGFDPAWVAVARTILAAFLLLVGVGLVLGHGDGIRWASFWRRWAFVAAGALVITLITWFAFPASFVYFGVLHAIALFSLLALPFIRAPLWLVGLVALVVIGLHFAFTDPLYNAREWSWIGFWQAAPPANDLVPVFPWFGVVLLGIFAARIARAQAWDRRLATIAPTNPPARVLGWLGRWSLPIYLVHQPILLAILFPLASLLQPQMAMRTTDFLRSCQSTCEAGGTPAAMCTTYCQCGLENVEANDLWDAIYSGLLDADQQSRLEASNRQCSALIYPELDTAPQQSTAPATGP